ncbi:tRNA (N6-isopentenyl adenosine(37)-C2)-methylthiotransferase MiaB [Enterobacteriaceae endosymbiont of Plateumaris braccata]|uniref:tRNA (N6-isopentenyl adenosine(37)-C2)-methylthiotransferase MiaB n=1 Tax=Enterobacteriaceae endosymbiont of Plateumaris braccata TaxID=2675793 RepID=UPI0014496B02|nr:tRNA (N6-isopentenyl adenosine(37)-C2)-methylthiotransferase MiaB [Enterobacteriaceae endosymbiont of Plateumaris braccata]QJC28258.1 tRNA (N6-isopentenyl adenosine(37)-C2)-methylthiotransferase MiaB [Enterobacteriaceae endosymbiont of Plateumaris braccata]
MLNNKLYIKTWGCQMNEYDSSKIADLMVKELNCKLTQTINNANIIILNTCSIREKAQEKLFHQLGRWKNLKKINPNIIIGVGGCVAVQEGKKILNRANHVDIIFGPQTLHRIPMMVKKIRIFKKYLIDISFPKIEKFNYFPLPKKKNISEFISIIEGCNKYCTYCIVPHTRGKEVSRPYQDIIKEIKILSKQGVKEIHLLGQNVNAYKYTDLENNVCNFSELLRKVSKIKDIKRIRFTTSHPQNFSDELIQTYYKIPQLVSFVHLPVQSGSNKILSLMKRRYNIIEYKNIIKKLRVVRPNIQISSDFIVGFPGETQNDFYQTISLILDINFDMSFSFIYSPRPGTPASKLTDNISEYEKKQRLYILQYYIKKQIKKNSKKMLNTIQTILVEGISPQNEQFFFGRTENNRVVFFLNKYNFIGKLVNVKITAFYLYSLHGKFISLNDN